MIKSKAALTVGCLLLCLLLLLFLILVYPSLKSAKPVVSLPYATIRGSVSYPSEAFPHNLMICAQQIDGLQNKTCTGPWDPASYSGDKFVTGDEFIYGVGFSLNVPAGQYQVYTIVPSLFSEETMIAYYTPFIACIYGPGTDEEKSNCPSDHKPATITVPAGQTIDDIMPGDWYGPTTD